jgi:pimeloyl-ACP methyl ester carboxylesterase
MQGPPRVRTATLAVAIIGVVVFAIILAFALLFEQVERAREREHFPQIGRSFDVGGRMMNIYCSGAGQPAIVLESGATWPFLAPKEMFEQGAPRPGFSWVWIQKELSKLTTACWYDRAGSGWSDLGPYPRDSASQARDLHALLLAAAVPSPYVLVAESSATADARVYAGFYPTEVAGLVIVNGVDPDFFINTQRGRAARYPRFVGRSQDLLAQALNQIGLPRFATERQTPATPKNITTSEWNIIWHLTQSAKARSALMQDIACWQQSASQVRSAGSLGDRPLVVLSSENPPAAPQHGAEWLDMQTEMARLSSRGKHVVVKEGNGDLLYQAPDEIVGAIRQVIRQTRNQSERR